MLFLIWYDLANKLPLNDHKINNNKQKKMQQYDMFCDTCTKINCDK